MAARAQLPEEYTRRRDRLQEQGAGGGGRVRSWAHVDEGRRRPRPELQGPLPGAREDVQLLHRWSKWSA
ncbi:hypothetical protein ZEAMMB73_Zm00001d000352 [Zea mays]|nr:hypothetical protein ZEAMMB73_Zm00001d000352 [Zea mays]